jgi:hypothetical protein
LGILYQCRVFIHGLGGIQRMHGGEPLPIGDRLVVNGDIGLGKEAHEATFYSEVPRSGARIFGTHAAPAVEFGTGVS